MKLRELLDHSLEGTSGLVFLTSSSHLSSTSRLCPISGDEERGQGSELPPQQQGLALCTPQREDSVVSTTQRETQLDPTGKDSIHHYVKWGREPIGPAGSS